MDPYCILRINENILEIGFVSSKYMIFLCKISGHEMNWEQKYPNHCSRSFLCSKITEPSPSINNHSDFHMSKGDSGVIFITLQSLAISLLIAVSRV